MSKNYHLRDIPSVPFYVCKVPAAFRATAIANAVPLLGLTGYKRDEKVELAVQCLRALVDAGRAGKAVGDTRDHNQPGVKLRADIWDRIVAAGLAIVCKGSAQAGKRARYFATGRLLDYFRNWPLPDVVSLELDRNTTMPKDPSWDSLLLVQEKWRDDHGRRHKDLVPLGRKHLETVLGGVTVQSYLETVEDEVEQINAANLRHTWAAWRMVDGKRQSLQPNVCLKQVHSRQLFRHARLYTWGPASGQGIGKDDRRRITIDGEAATELDYGGFHTRMVYHIVAKQDPPGDIYQPQLIFPKYWEDACGDGPRAGLRDLVKRLTNACWCVSSRARAVRLAGHYLFGRGAKRFGPIGEYENCRPSVIVDRIVEAHAPIAGHFFRNVGELLTTLDSALMLRVLLTCAKEDKPALGIHDSVLCKAADRAFVRSWMLIHYHTMFGFYPQISVVF